MECDNYVNHGLYNTEGVVRCCRIGFQLGAPCSGALRLDIAAGLPGAPRHVAVVSTHPPEFSHCAPHTDHPFMNTMDEISYWIYTKRAPCLMNYDNEIKKQSLEAQNSKTKQKSVLSVAEVPSPKKKKKRKLSLFDDKSTSTEKQNHVYFDTSQNKKQTVISSCKSDSLGSDIDFNIKISSVQGKGKRLKLLKNSKTTLHKKNKLVTSTPKVSQLRRSLRQAQLSLNNNNSQLNSSFEIFNASVINGHQKNGVVHQRSPGKIKQSTELHVEGDKSTENKNIIYIPTTNKSKNEVHSGQFEDLSDVSGFTANYIRSTKLQSTKTPRKLRCKNNKNLVKDSEHNAQKDSRMVVCVNKSVNTTHKSAVQNCSTDSENIINLVTVKSTERAAKVSKSTTLLKFIDSTTSKDNTNDKVVGTRTRKANMNISFQSKSSTSRYPKRYRNCSKAQKDAEVPQNKTTPEEKRKRNNKNLTDFNNSDRKENPEATVASKMRSGRNIGLTLRQPENSVLVLSNSTEQVSSMVSMNVARPTEESKKQKKRHVTRHLRSMKEQTVHLQRDSLKDKSGFTACFSDSDEDNEQLKQRKFFCA